MALLDVLDTLKAACADDETGLAAQCATILRRRELSPDAIRTDFAFDDWMLADALKPAGPRAAFRPVSYDGNVITVAQAGQRAARARLQVSIATVDADPARLQLALATYATAFLLVLDHLFEYSAARGGTIALVEDPCAMAFGPFAGGPSGSGAPTQHGFNATVSILERSLT